MYYGIRHLPFLLYNSLFPHCNVAASFTVNQPRWHIQVSTSKARNAIIIRSLRQSSLVLPSIHTNCEALIEQRQKRSRTTILQLFESDNELRSIENRLQIRDWSRGEGDAILRLLVNAEKSENESNLMLGSGYDVNNPEGLLNVDLENEGLIRESYNPDDGGCFLVAVMPNEKNEFPMIVGTAGLIIGTPVSYFSSGSSISSSVTTAAIRRAVVCMDVDQINPQEVIDYKINIMKKLILELEDRAVISGADECIILGYDIANFSECQYLRPTPALLNQLGYKPLSVKNSNMDIRIGRGGGINNSVISYLKKLKIGKMETSDNSAYASSRVGNIDEIDNYSVAKDEMNNNIDFTSGKIDESKKIQSAIIAFSVLLVAGITTFVLSSIFSLLELSPSESNTIIGSPLSTNELEQMIRQERNSRIRRETTAFDPSTNQEWNDLTPEEQREELALWKVIQGQNTRSK